MISPPRGTSTRIPLLAPIVMSGAASASPSTDEFTGVITAASGSTGIPINRSSDPIAPLTVEDANENILDVVCLERVCQTDAFRGAGIVTRAA